MLCSCCLVQCVVFSLGPLASEISRWRIWPFVNSSQCSSESARALGCEGRIASLGVAVQELEGLAPGVDHRKTGDGRGLASQGLLFVLDLDFQAEERTSRSQPRG